MDNSKDISTFLEKNFPQHDCILVGCQADDDIIVHDCCEYNIIALSESHDSYPTPLYYKIFETTKRKSKLNFQVQIIPAAIFHDNTFIRYSDYVYFPRKALRNTEIDHFRKKHENFRKTFKFEIKKELFDNIYNLSFLSNYLSQEFIDEKMVSFELKMASLRTLRNYVQLYSGKEHRPSHLKHQINSIIQSQSIKLRERIDNLLEFLGMHKANVSALERSEKSLRMLSGNLHSPTKNLILKKVNFFKHKSMYVDGLFLIYNYVADNFQEQEQKTSYQELLKRITDIDSKEKIFLKKEIKLLIEYNKLLLT